LAFPSQPPNWVDGQQALINGVTYVYSSANVSWSPLTSANTLTYPTITATTSTITGTETVGNSVVTGNEAVQGNETVSGNQIVLGNLGVGTNTPLSKLDVRDTNSIVFSRGTGGYGSFYAQGSTTNPSYMFFGNANNGEQNRITSQDGGVLTFSSGNAATSRLIIDSNGNVGIGTTSPSSAGANINLVVNNSTSVIIRSQGGSNYSRFDLTTTTANSYTISGLYENSGSPYYQFSSGAGVLNHYYDGPNHIFRNVAGTIRMNIDSSGNIGIGTASPEAQLTVSHPTTPTIFISETGGVGQPTLFLKQYGTNGEGLKLVYDSSTGHSYINNVYVSGNLYFQTVSTTRMMIDSVGTVNLYGGNGSTQLAMRNGGDLVIYSGDNAYGTTIWCDNPTTGMTNTGYTFTEYLNLNSQRCGYDRLWDNYPSISVRNDTTNGPQGEFRIHGINGISGGDFSVYLRVDGGGNGSDRRRKTDIEPITNALETISKLKPVTYVATNSSLEKQTEMSMANGKRLGFIAQDLIPVLPEVVKDSGVENIRENGWADQYAVDYASMVSLLTASIQELKAIVDAQAKTIEGLQELKNLATYPNAVNCN